MPRVTVLIGAIFALAGAAALTGGFWLAHDQWRFSRSAIETWGTVVGQVELESDDDEPVFAPLVEWRDEAGTQRRFRGRLGQNDPAYELGETVAMAYDPRDPNDARLTAFWPAWMRAIIATVLGVAFLAVGIWFLEVYRRERRRIAHLESNGIPVEARFLYAYPSNSGSRRERVFWRIVCTAPDPKTGGKRNFKTPPTSRHPSEFEEATFRVLIDPVDPRSYFVDIPALQPRGDTA